jgi:hypothetical protein
MATFITTPEQWLDLGDAADTGDGSAQVKLTAEATAYALDPAQYVTWKEVAQAINQATPCGAIRSVPAPAPLVSEVKLTPRAMMLLAITVDAVVKNPAYQDVVKRILELADCDTVAELNDKAAEANEDEHGLTVVECPLSDVEPRYTRRALIPLVVEVKCKHQDGEKAEKECKDVVQAVIRAIDGTTLPFYVGAPSTTLKIGTPHYEAP